MSAKEFNGRSEPAHLPYLPPELWMAIIQHATWVPGGYDPELSTLAFSVCANTMKKERVNEWRKALITRRSLVRVSKAWYTLASPFLYEYILLGKGKAVPPLLRGIQRSQQGINPMDTIRSIGWWTKRLDVNFRDSTSNRRVDMDALADLMTRLPNLRILTFSITGHQYKQKLSRKILRSVSCCETLKFVHFYTYCLPSSKNWAVFLERHPNLESVDLNYWLFDTKFRTRLDFLHTIHLNVHPQYDVETFPEDPSWYTNFPAVRAVTYDLVFSSNEIQMERFFTTFGPKLTTIQLNQLHPDPDNPYLNLEETLHWIRSECHALEHISLLFCSWSFLTLFEYASGFASKVSTLVIRIIKGQISKQMTAHLFANIFPPMKRQSPNLKTVQFSSAMNVRGLRTNPKALANGLRDMRSIGLVIKDDEGCVMK